MAGVALTGQVTYWANLGMESITSSDRGSALVSVGVDVGGTAVSSRVGMTIVGEDIGGTLGLGSTSTVGDGEGCSAVLVASGIAVAGGTVGLETASAAGDVIVGAVSWSLQATNRSRTETIK